MKIHCIDNAYIGCLMGVCKLTFFLELSLQIHHIVDRHNLFFYKYASSSMCVFLMILYNVLNRLSLLLQEYKSCLIRGHIILP